MKLAREFQFNTLYNDEIVYVARKWVDEDRYTIRWEHLGNDYKVEHSAEQVADFIKDATWRVLRVTVDSDGNALHSVQAQLNASPLEVGDDLIEGTFEAEMPHVYGEIKYVDNSVFPLVFCVTTWSGNEYVMKQDLSDGNYSINYRHGTRASEYAYTVEEMNEFIKSGAWKLVDEFTSEAEEGVILTEGDGHCAPYVVATDCAPAAIKFFDEQTIVGAELEAVRRFCEENEGWYVEVDADFYAVKHYDHDDVVFTVANEAQLAEVMQAIRTLNKYEDRG